MLYLDAAQDRRTEEHRDAIEKVRVGSIFATPQGHKSYTRWRRATTPRPTAGLVGGELESAVMNVARLFPRT